MSPSPAGRAKHSAVFDQKNQVMIVYGGENGIMLTDLHFYHMRDNSWSTSGAEGPSPRSGHTAVWDSVTFSMLVLGGWSGVKYLADLHHYDAWGDRWTELFPSSALHARAGHAAAWDPVSMSMLVLAGIENNTNTGSLGYDSSFTSYSLLSNTWSAHSSLGSGRVGHAVVWDSEAPALFTFGGFNTTYLSEVWRYVSSPLQSLMVASCQLGHECFLNSATQTSVSLIVKQTCSEEFDIVLKGWASDDNKLALRDAANSSLLFVEPGDYRLCLCSQAVECTQSFGFFIVEGPYSNQQSQCVLGSHCIVFWRGVGISSRDHVVATKKCGAAEATVSFGQRPIVIQSTSNLSSLDNKSKLNLFGLDLGFVSLTGPPEVVEVCWCPETHQCSAPEDFRAIAVQLQVVCPPGMHEHQEALQSSCQHCSSGHYCPGGVDAEEKPCPYASTTPPNASVNPRFLLRQEC